jgi:hypothetical protein
MVQTRNQKMKENKIETLKSGVILDNNNIDRMTTRHRSNSPISVQDNSYSDTENSSNMVSDDEYNEHNENNCVNQVIKKIQNTVPTIRPYIVSAYHVSALYIFWIVLHYTTAQLYVKYCASPSIYGFLISPFLISAPHCMAMRWVFNKGGTLIESMWILLGTWLCSKIITRTT